MTLDEIAKLAGVSKTTASYVINGKASQYRISDKTQQKVLAVVEQYNYRPDSAASALRAGNSRSFGLIVPDIENSSYARLAKLLERNARLAGYQLLIANSDDDPQAEKDICHNLLSRRIDALFVASGLPDANEFYLAIQAKGTPVIGLDRQLDDEYFCSVVSEDFTGCYQLTSSVLSAGSQSVGLIGALPDLNISHQRQLGFESAAKARHIASVTGYGEQFNAAAGKQVLLRWLADEQCPDAIVTTSYTLLEGVLDVLFERPELIEKVQLATFGDNRLLDFLPFKVHSLPQQFELIADSALELALNASAKRYHPNVELIERKLKLRQ